MANDGFPKKVIFIAGVWMKLLRQTSEPRWVNRGSRPQRGLEDRRGLLAFSTCSHGFVGGKTVRKTKPGGHLTHLLVLIWG